MLALLNSCQKDLNQVQEENILVLGHIYRWGGEGDKVDEILEDIDYNQYEELWLLGDLCAATTKEQSTLEYLDQIFSLSRNECKWSIGNHDIDYGNLDWIKEKTNRDFHYGEINDNYAIFVLNSQIEHKQFKDSCSYKQNQFDSFEKFIEDIEISDSVNNIFILSHNTIWSDAETSLSEFNLIGNARSAWMDFLCKWGSEFRHTYHPKLLELREKGKNIYCVAGDGGQYQKTFYHEGVSGIHYYVSGINNSVIEYSDESTISRFNTSPDSVLLFSFDQSSQSFLGRFIPLSNL